MSALTEQDIKLLWESYLNGNIAHVYNSIVYSGDSTYNVVRWMLAGEAAGATSMDVVHAASVVFIR